jgi:hypothetical protein
MINLSACFIRVRAYRDDFRRVRRRFRDRLLCGTCRRWAKAYSINIAHAICQLDQLFNNACLCIVINPLKTTMMRSFKFHIIQKQNHYEAVRSRHW